MPKENLHWRRQAPEKKQPIYSYVDPEIENEIDKRAWFEASPIWPPAWNTWSAK